MTTAHTAAELLQALEEIRDLTRSLCGDVKTPTFDKVHAIAAKYAPAPAPAPVIERKARPIFVLKRTPGAAEADTVEWTDICHGQKGKRFVFIDHSPYRSPSRWTYADNKRPFIVRANGWQELGRSSTLEGAMKIARREA